MYLVAYLLLDIMHLILQELDRDNAKALISLD